MMKFNLITIVLAIALLSCSKLGWDNPLDPEGDNYSSCSGVELSSGSKVSSSSSNEAGSSSSDKASSSSSSEVSSSSSGKVNLSSSSEVSSSSACTAEDNSGRQYCSNGTMKTYGSIKDQSNNEYKTVVIGEQTWMAENLNYGEGLGICYGGQPSNCSTYGKLYNWLQAMGCSISNCEYEKDICPIGWHLPSREDWNKLICYVTGFAVTEGSTCNTSTAGMHLKATSGWTSGGNGLDTYGFSARPGGYQNSSVGSSNAGSGGYWWSADLNGTNAYRFYMLKDKDDVTFDVDNKSTLHSVRCVKN